MCIRVCERAPERVCVYVYSNFPCTSDDAACSKLAAANARVTDPKPTYVTATTSCYEYEGCAARTEFCTDNVY